MAWTGPCYVRLLADKTFQGAFAWTVHRGSMSGFSSGALEDRFLSIPLIPRMNELNNKNQRTNVGPVSHYYLIEIHRETK